MTHLKQVSRPQSRSALLKQAYSRLQEEQSSGRFSLIDPRLADLPGLIERLDAAFKVQEAATQQRSLTIKARRIRAQALYQMISHFKSSTLRRASRLGNGETLRTLFNFNDKLIRQASNDHRLLLELAKAISLGETKALAAGFEPSTNPSLAEVTALASDADPIFSQAERAIQDLKQAQEEMRQAQEAVEPYMKRLTRYLRSETAEYSKPVQREILRSFGYRFTSGPKDGEHAPKGSEPEPSGGTTATANPQAGREEPTSTDQEPTPKKTQTAVA